MNSHLNPQIHSGTQPRDSEKEPVEGEFSPLPNEFKQDRKTPSRFQHLKTQTCKKGRSEIQIQGNHNLRGRNKIQSSMNLKTTDSCRHSN